MSPNATDKNWLLYEFILSDLNRFVYHEIDSFGWSWDRIIFGKKKKKKLRKFVRIVVRVIISRLQVDLILAEVWH